MINLINNFINVAIKINNRFHLLDQKKIKINLIKIDLKLKEKMYKIKIIIINITTIN